MSQVAAKVQIVPQVEQLLNNNKAKLASAIPANSGLTPDRLIRVALTQLRKNPALLQCDPISFLSAVMQAAQLGLEFGELKQCALVPYNKDVQLLIQYQGYLALLWRSREIESVQAHIVYEGDFFEVEYGSNSKLIHKPTFHPGAPIAFYAAVNVRGGGFMFELMTVKQVEEHRDRYAKGYDRSTSPWKTAFNAMALKTVLRRLIKLLPLAADSPVSDALRYEESELSELRNHNDVPHNPEVYRQLTEAPDIPTAADRQVVAEKFKALFDEADKMQISIDDLIKGEGKLIYDQADIKTLTALCDAITSRLESAANPWKDE